MALSVWSLKMRNAGTPRRRASSNRQLRSASSTGDSVAAGVRFIFDAADDFTPVPVLRFEKVDAFFFRFRLLGGAEVSFRMNLIGVVLSAARPDAVSLTVRYEICLPSFSKTASDNRVTPARAIAPSTS